MIKLQDIYKMTKNIIKVLNNINVNVMSRIKINI